MIRPIQDIDTFKGTIYECNICGEEFSYSGLPKIVTGKVNHFEDKHHLILDAHGYVYFHRVIR